MTDHSGKAQPAFAADDEFEVLSAVSDQLATASYLLSDQESGPSSLAGFTTNAEFWQSLFHERLRSGSVVRLDDFAVLEWFPRSPGLFHTEDGDWSRRWAAAHLYADDDEQTEALRAVDSTLTVYRPVGKDAMLNGGFGCFRMRDRVTDRGRLWFMSASSNAVAHEGIPIGVPDSIRDELIDAVANDGAAFGGLVGRLRFVPELLDSVYHGYRDVPRLYLQVEEFRPIHRRGRREPVASGGVAFTYRTSLPDGLSFREQGVAYVPFRPGADGNLDRRVRWLEVYVEQFGGTVITDFDEHRSRFRNATFSLAKVADGRINETAATEALDGVVRTEIRPDGTVVNLFVEQLMIDQARLNVHRARIGRIVMGDNFSNIGAGATIINRSVVTNALNRWAGDDGEMASALRAITKHVEASGDSAAAENLEAFLEEAGRDQPRKARLKSFWDGLVAVLPSVAQLGTAAEKAIQLFVS